MRTTAVFDKIAFQYDENRGGEARGARFAQKLIPLLGSKQKVLELGVGTGVVAGAIEMAGFDIVGIDNSQEMLKRALSRVRTVVWGDMNRLPFIDGYFGTVYAVWAFHLAGDIPGCLAEIRRVLAAGGCFLNCAAAHGPSGDRIGQIVWEMQRQLSGTETELTVDSPNQLALHGSAAGFVLEDIIDLPQEYTTTANTVATHLERRGMSTLQRATPEQVRLYIEPAIAALRAFPDPDAAIVRSTLHQIAVLRAV